MRQRASQVIQSRWVVDLYQKSIFLVAQSLSSKLLATDDYCWCRGIAVKFKLGVREASIKIVPVFVACAGCLDNKTELQDPTPAPSPTYPTPPLMQHIFAAENAFRIRSNRTECRTYTVVQHGMYGSIKQVRTVFRFYRSCFSFLV
jgi:hypothetical protein